MAAEPPTGISDNEADGLLARLETATGIALAVSGGGDSLALLHLAAGWQRRRRPGIPMLVLTVDHGLRADAAAEARLVAEQAAAAGLDHQTLVWDGPKPASGLQAAAREARYRLMAGACAERGLDHLVTAHHLDDQAETVLMRLARGSGVDGLSAMPASSDRNGLTIARPLLEVPKTRLIATLAAAGIGWIEDPSNADPRHARARLRAMMPDLAVEGLTPRRLADTARRMRRAREALETCAADLHRRAVSDDPAGFAALDPRVLADAPEEFALRVLARLLMGIGGADYPPRLERLERLHAAIVSAAKAGTPMRPATLAGCRVVPYRGAVAVLREEGREALPEVAVRAGGTIVWDRRFRIEALADAGWPATVRPLGADGLSAMRRITRTRAIPAAAARTTPAVFVAGSLEAAPLVEQGGGRFSPDWLKVTFLGTARFAPVSPGVGPGGGTGNVAG